MVLQRPGDHLTLLVILLLTLVLSAAVGWQTVVLSMAAMSLSLIERTIARQGGTSTVLQAGTLVGLGWLAGHTVLAPLTWVSLTLACCFGSAYQGTLELDRNVTLQTKSARLTWALGLLYGGQAAALALLVVLGHALAAALAGFLLAPQWLLLALLETRSPRSYARQATPFVIAAMLVAAWAVAA
jgi:hypothetical protein